MNFKIRFKVFFILAFGMLFGISIGHGAYVCKLATQLDHSLPGSYVFSPAYIVNFGESCTKLCAMTVDCDFNGEKFQDTALCKVDSLGRCPKASDCVQSVGLISASVPEVERPGESHVVNENPSAQSE